jgi:PKD repeat protein
MNFFLRRQRRPDRHTCTSREGLKFQATALSLAGLLLAATASAAPGFSNGFEDNDLGGWEITDRAGPNEIEIVGPEGANQFPVYGNELDESVEPYNGELMLRIGTPKTSNETQPRGVNAISQEFEATSNSISVALRLFSLDHRGDDILRITLTPADPDGAPVVADTFYFFENKQGTNCKPSCASVIDVGKRKDVIATDWQLIGFSGLEVGNVYTLSIELEAGQNESLASWLYVDGGNEAPSAVINYNPKEPVEGDFVVLDCGSSVDPEGSDLTCTWKADFEGKGQQTEIAGETVVFWAAGDRTVDVTLTVSDGEKSATDTKPITISDQPALVNALDVEVLAGGTVDLVCRYVDPGIDDVQTVEFYVTSGLLVDGTYRFAKENDPALASGYARVTYKAPDNPGSFTESCRVGDSSAAFQITVLDSVPDRSAALLGSIDSAPIVNADQSILGKLNRPENIAVYELRDADGFKFTQGTEVVVTANFPVDYDIVLLSGSADPAAKPWASAPFVSAPFVSAPFVSVPFVSAPFVSAPFVSAPFVSAPFVSAPFVSAPFVSAPFVSAPFVSAPLTQSLWRTAGFEFESFPLSLLAGAPDGSNISGADISFGDLGALNAGSLANAQVFLKGLSANFDTSTEQVLVKIGPGEDGLYVAVLPQSGSFSAAPFNIEVEAAIPPKMSQLMPEVCQGSLLVGGGDDPDVPDAPRVAREKLAALPVAPPLRDGSKTLIVTQKERMMQTFNLTEEDWQAWMNGMENFFGLVDAKVISVPSEWYDYADLSPCVVDEQNQVAELIKQAIATHRTDATQYVQLMGSLDIIPPYYVPDETQTGNESLFASDLLTQPGTPLGAAISEGYMLTDAFYVDSDPQPFNGRQLYLEDISVSRLVETPDEILANAQRFYESGGIINLISSPRSTGYDFFIDGTEVINDKLRNLAGNVDTLLSDSWNATELRCLFFGTGEGCSTPVSNLNAINAHMSYNAGLTAKGFACQYLGDTDCPESELGEVFLSSESADILVNGVTFSIGCHSGLSVPDAWGLPDDVGLPLDPARDWVQELGTWVGSYNFAYGDTDVADRGTEGIIPLVIENFTNGMTLGEALVRAKWKYGAGLFEFGVYDEKSLVGLNLFGMPQARLASSVNGPSTSAFFNTITLGTDPNLSLEIATELQSNDKGVWFAAGGQAQAIVGRPLLPVIKPFELEPVNGTTIHGVALRGGTYTTYPGLNPVFPAQTHDLVTSIGEPQPCVETLSPSLLASANRFDSDSPSGSLESLVVQPGQFRCTNGGDRLNPDGTTNPGYEVNGEFRIWNTLNLEVLRPIDVAYDKDLKPPVVILQDLLRIPGTDDVTATLVARDEASTDTEGAVIEASGMREIIALVYSDDLTGGGAGGIPGEATAYSHAASDGVPVEFILPDAFDKQLSFQYIDKAGNITAKTLKGALLRAIDVSITTSIINQNGITEIRVKIEDFNSLVAPYLTIDYGDGTDPEVIELDDPNLCEFSGESCTIVILKDYGDFAGSITIKVEVRASGAVGSDEKTISACSDTLGDTKVPGADIIGCSITADGTKLTIGVVIAGALAPDIQYRLVLTQTNTQIKFSNGATTGPSKLKPKATPGLTSDGNGLVTFEFEAGKLPWNGVSPFQFKFETQSGVAGGQGQGFIDTTDVKTFTP